MKTSLDSETFNTCLVMIDSQKIKAGIAHLGQGRYKILKHDGGEQHIGRIVDASNTIHCRISTTCKDEWLPKEAFKTKRCSNCKNFLF